MEKLGPGFCPLNSFWVWYTCHIVLISSESYVANPTLKADEEMRAMEVDVPCECCGDSFLFFLKSCGDSFRSADGMPMGCQLSCCGSTGIGFREMRVPFLCATHLAHHMFLLWRTTYSTSTRHCAEYGAMRLRNGYVAATPGIRCGSVLLGSYLEHYSMTNFKS